MSGRSVRSILEPRRPVLRLAHDLEPVRLEDRTRRGAEARVVVDDEDGGGHARIVADRPGEPQCGKPHSGSATQMQENRARRCAIGKTWKRGSCALRGGRREIGPILRHTPAMSQTTDVSVHDRILADRARYVSAGVSTPRLVVAHADGARVTDVDGRSFIDFAGGIGCQNTGHRFGPVVEAIKRAGSTSTCTSASWSASTSPTSRSAGGWPSSRRAPARSRSRSSSTPAPRRSRTRSRSRARPPAARRSSSSTTRSTAARC